MPLKSGLEDLKYKISSQKKKESLGYQKVTSIRSNGYCGAQLN